MKEKIEKINKLTVSIGELKAFLELLEETNVDSEYGDKMKPKRNEFSRLYVQSYIWTGSDNPSYEKKISDRETINELAEVMKVVLRGKIELKEMELKSLVR